MRTIFLIITFLIMCRTAFTQNNRVPQKKADSINLINEKCLNLLKGYSEYWVKDSIGDNGFRFLAVQNIEQRCQPIGKPWGQFEIYFGKANETYSKEGNKFLEYKITNYIQLETNKILFIKVDSKGIIKSFSVLNPG